jgi:hypothetical protein
MIASIGLALLLVGLAMAFVAESARPRADYLLVTGVGFAALGGTLIVGAALA